MIVSYSQANRELDRLLELFLVGCAAATLIGVAQRSWWFAVVWLTAGLLDCAIRVSARPGRAGDVGRKGDAPDNDAAVPGEELASQRVFAGKFLRFSGLLAATASTAALALGSPWWSSLVAALAAWFVSLFGIVLLCAPRTEGEKEGG